MSTGIVLALGGGGARGFAHLGVLEVLAAHRIPVAGMVGTSMGAVVAALVGAGTPIEYLEKLAVNFPWTEMLDLNLSGLGLVEGDKILAVLELLCKGKSLAELEPAVWVVATDLDRGVPVVFKEGKVAPAVRASISVPGIFAPFQWGGMTLVDGGVLAGVPVEIARSMGRPVVAVDVGFELMRRRVRHVLDVVFKVVNIMGGELDRRQVTLADLSIRPAVGHVGSAQFELAGECVAAGRQAAEEALPSLLALAGRTGA